MRRKIKACSHQSLRRIVAGMLSVLVLVTGVPPIEASPASSVLSFSLSPEWGAVEGHLPSGDSRSVIIIQDAHDSVQAQHQIQRILHHLVNTNVADKVFEEGAEGRLDLETYFSWIEGEKNKNQLARRMVDDLFLSGADYAFLTAEKPFELLGAENKELHRENVLWYGRAVEQQVRVESDLEYLRREMRRAFEAHMTPEAWQWKRLAERYENEKIDLKNFLHQQAQLLVRIDPGVDFKSEFPLTQQVLSGRIEKGSGNELSTVEFFKEIQKLNEFLGHRLAAESPALEKILAADQLLRLFDRLNKLKLSPEEFEALREPLSGLDVEELARFLSKLLKRPVVLSKRWTTWLESARKFYELAEARDEEVLSTLRGAWAEEVDKPFVLVFGGFHTARIKRLLTQEGASVCVITPRIDSISKKHQKRYFQMMTGPDSFFQASVQPQAASPIRPYSVLTPSQFRDWALRRYPSFAGSAARSEVRSKPEENPVPLSETPEWRETLDRVLEKIITQGSVTNSDLAPGKVEVHVYGENRGYINLGTRNKRGLYVYSGFETGPATMEMHLTPKGVPYVALEQGKRSATFEIYATPSIKAARMPEFHDEESLDKNRLRRFIRSLIEKSHNQEKILPEDVPNETFNVSTQSKNGVFALGVYQERQILAGTGFSPGPIQVSLSLDDAGQVVLHVRRDQEERQFRVEFKEKKPIVFKRINKKSTQQKPKKDWVPPPSRQIDASDKFQPLLEQIAAQITSGTKDFDEKLFQSEIQITKNNEEDILILARLPNRIVSVSAVTLEKGAAALRFLKKPDGVPFLVIQQEHWRFYVEFFVDADGMPNARIFDAPMDSVVRVLDRLRNQKPVRNEDLFPETFYRKMAARGLISFGSYEGRYIKLSTMFGGGIARLNMLLDEQGSPFIRVTHEGKQQDFQIAFSAKGTKQLTFPDRNLREHPIIAAAAPSEATRSHQDVEASELLAALEASGWRVRQAIRAVGLDEPRDYAAFFSHFELTEELRARIVQTAAKQKWVKAAIGRELDLSGKVLNTLLKKLEIRHEFEQETAGEEPDSVTVQRILEVLEASDWNFSRFKFDLDLPEKVDLLGFLRRYGLAGQLKRKLKERLALHHRSIPYTAALFGVGESQIRSWMEKLGVPASLMTRDEVLAVLTETNWSFRRAKPLLESGFQRDFYAFLKHYDLLEELKTVLVSRLEANQWQPQETAEIFECSRDVIQRLMLQLQIAKPKKTPQEVRAIVLKHDWNFEKIKLELGLLPKIHLYDFIVENGLEQEFKETLSERLEAHHWVLSSVNKTFGVSANLILVWISKLGLERPVLSQDELTQILDRHRWNLRLAASELVIDYGESYYDYFKRQQYLPQITAWLEMRLEASGWILKTVASELDIAASSLRVLLNRLDIRRKKLTAEQVLEMIRDNDWRLGELDEEIGRLPWESYYAFLKKYGLESELKSILLQRLDENQWGDYATGESFGVKNRTIKSWVRHLKIEKPIISKAEITEILNRHQWKLRAAKKDLGFKLGETYGQFYKRHGYEQEMREKIISVLEPRRWAIVPSAAQLGLSGRALEGLMAALEIEPPSLTREEILEVLEAHGWNLSAAADELRINEVEGYFDFFKSNDLLAELRTRIHASMSENEQSIPKTASHFGVSYPTMAMLIRRLEQEEGIAEVRRLIRRHMDEIFGPYLSWMSVRYGVDIKNLIWGALGHEIRGRYDRSVIEELIDMELIDLMEFRRDDRLEIEPLSEPESNQPAQVFDASALSQESIRTVAGQVQQALENQIVEEGLEEMIRGQAAHFLFKLEMQYLFRIFFSLEKDDTWQASIKAELEKLSTEEMQPFLAQHVIPKVVEKINDALDLLKKMYAAGLNPETKLDLYQLTGVQQILSERKILLADEMGLGKTLQALSAFFLSGQDEMLVVAPKSGLKRWMDELVRHTQGDFEIVLATTEQPLEALEEDGRFQITRIASSAERLEYLLSKRVRPETGRKRIILTNFGVLSRLQRLRDEREIVTPLQTGFLTVDEAHAIKNTRTLLARSLTGDADGRGAAEAVFKVLMTGTPLENRPRDLFNYIRILSAEEDTPAAVFFRRIPTRRLARLFASSRLEMLSHLHGYLAGRMIRRLKGDVISGLPEKQVHNVYLDPEAGVMRLENETISLPGQYKQQHRLYQYARESIQDFETVYGSQTAGLEDEGQSEASLSYGSRRILRMEQASLTPQIFGVNGDSVKFDAARLLIDERIRMGKSVLVFSDYRGAAREFYQYLQQFYPPETLAYVDGTVRDSAAGNNRHNQVEAFQSGRAPVMIATTGTMGEAVELTQADTVLFLNFPWKPSTYEQAIDRAHRIDPLRNYDGKILEIINLQYASRYSIDEIKQRVLERKRILAEMLIEGNLSQEILQSFDDSLVEALEDLKAGDEGPVEFDDHELSLVRQFRLLIGRILTARDANERARLWNEAAAIYIEILNHKGSFFANMASLDYLSGEQFPELKGRVLRTLDLASGPSTLERAYLRKRGEFQKRNFFLDITDYDASPEMLRAGLPREGRQYLGSFENLEGTFPDGHFDFVNLSFAFRYAAHPAALIRTIHRLLKTGGVFALVLPRNTTVPDRFLKALEGAGFELRVGSAGKLISELNAETQQHILDEFGPEFARDVSRYAEAEFTYVVAGKRGEAASDFSDEDFHLARETLEIDADKIREFVQKPGRQPIIPEEITVAGRVVYYSDLFTPPELHLSSAHTPQAHTSLHQRLGRQISVASGLAQRHASLNQKGVRARQIQRKLQSRLIQALENLERELAAQAQALQPNEQNDLRERLRDLGERNMTRQWFNQHPETLERILALIPETARSEVRRAPESRSAVKPMIEFSKPAGLMLSAAFLESLSQRQLDEVVSLVLLNPHIDLYIEGVFSESRANLEALMRLPGVHRGYAGGSLRQKEYLVHLSDNNEESFPDLTQPVFAEKLKLQYDEPGAVTLFLALLQSVPVSELASRAEIRQGPNGRWSVMSDYLAGFSTQLQAELAIAWSA